MSLCKSLAISYTNEGYELAANNVLREWLTSRFPTSNLPPPDASQSLWHAREETTAAFIRVAQDLHARNTSDPDVQVGLGVLHYCDQDYDKAKDCFESALWVRPQVRLLRAWFSDGDMLLILISVGGDRITCCGTGSDRVFPTGTSRRRL